MSKIDEAVSLCSDPTKYKDFEKGLSLLDDLTMNRVFPCHTRAKALLALMKIAPDIAVDKISRFRDSIPFLEDSQLDNEVQMLCHLIEYPQINSHERLLNAVCLYNHDYIDMCYPLFAHLCNDISVLIDYRVEATRYLYYSQVAEHLKTAKKCLLSIIKSTDFPSDYRYKIIAGFITKTGLATMLNITRLNVDYNEKYVYTLQKEFFWERANGVRDRILSGQHILDMSERTINREEKDLVINELFDIATNYTPPGMRAEGVLPETPDDVVNVKADAADVVLRLGNAEQRTRAEAIIRRLGFEIINDRRVKATLFDKSRNVYNDKQSVHDTSINKSVNKFVEKLVKKNVDHFESYQSVHGAVTDLIYKSGLTPPDRIKAFKALNRISIDTATFTEAKITTAEIFVNVWKLMLKHNAEEVDVLKKRMIEELIEMSDTCSSGHASRLINVLSGYDVELKISWVDQVHANMSARMQVRIRGMTDATLQEKVVLGMIDGADAEDRDAFLKYVSSESETLRRELQKEFVGDGHIRQKEFDEYFESGMRNWI